MATFAETRFGGKPGEMMIGAYWSNHRQASPIGGIRNIKNAFIFLNLQDP
jgi:hypothetical protein